MAGRSAILKVDIVSDASKATKGIDETSSRFGKMGQNVKRVAAVAGAAVAVMAVKFGKDSVDAFVEAEKSHKALEDAVARFPKLADTSIDRLDKLNASLARKTRFDDDATASGQTVLAQFDLTGKQLEKVTPLMQDYAAKTGKDLPTSAKLLGKAFLGNTRALKDLGIDYKSTGDKGKDFANITALLNDKVGGFAEKEGKTAAGQAEILKNQFGEIQETVGSKLVPILTKLATILLSVITFIQDNSSVIGPLVAILGGLAAVVYAIITAQKAWIAVQTALNVVMSANPVGLVVLAIAGLVAVIILAYKHSETFRNVVDGAFRAVLSVVQSTFRWIQSNWPLLLAILTGPIGIAVLAIVRHWDTIKAGFVAVKDRIGDVIGTIVGFFGALPGRLVGAAGDLFGWLRDRVAGVRDFIAGRVDAIVGFFGNLPGRIGNAAGDLFGAIRDRVAGVRDYIAGVIGDIVGFFRDLPGRIAHEVSRIRLPDLNPFAAPVFGMVANPVGGVAGLTGPAGLSTAAWSPFDSPGWSLLGGASRSPVVVDRRTIDARIVVEGDVLDTVGYARKLDTISREHAQRIGRAATFGTG